MMRTSLWAGLALWGALATAQAQAQAPAPAPAAEPSKGEILAARQFKWLDRNGDGYLSREEVALFPKLAHAFDAADRDHDGLVSFEEIKAYAQAQRELKAQRNAPEPTAPAP